MNYEIITQRRNVLTDDYIEICDKGYRFTIPGGYRVRVIYNTPATEWSNEEHVFYAKSIKNALRRYYKLGRKVVVNDENDDGNTVWRELNKDEAYDYIGECLYGSDVDDKVLE